MSCEEGICGSCETRIISGEPDHRDSILTETERQASKTMVICCSGSKSPRLVLDISARVSCARRFSRFKSAGFCASADP